MSTTIYPEGMDPECIPLCDAMNSLPGIRTFESCCGHGKKGFNIFFAAETLEHLAPIMYALAKIQPRPKAWFLEANGYPHSFSQTITFLLRGPIDGVEMANKLAAGLKEAIPENARVKAHRPPLSCGVCKALVWEHSADQWAYCQEKAALAIPLIERLTTSHHAYCNYSLKRVGDCNCVSVMKKELDNLRIYAAKSVLMERQLQHIKDGKGWFQTTPAGQRSFHMVSEEQEVKDATEQINVLRAELDHQEDTFTTDNDAAPTWVTFSNQRTVSISPPESGAPYLLVGYTIQHCEQSPNRKHEVCECGAVGPEPSVPHCVWCCGDLTDEQITAAASVSTPSKPFTQCRACIFGNAVWTPACQTCENACNYVPRGM